MTDDPVEIIGGDAMVARLAALPRAIGAGLEAKLEFLSLALYDRVEASLQGGRVQQRSGRLAGSITRAVEKTAAGVSARIASDPKIAPYGAALEFGATLRARLIEARNAKALAFTVAGRQVFARRVQFPGARIAPRSFLRGALGEVAPNAGDELAAAVAAAVAP